MKAKLDSSEENPKNHKTLKAKIQIYTEKYVAVLTNQAKIYWDLKDWKSVEELFKQNTQICADNKIFQTNMAHSVYMQEHKHKEAIAHYEQIVNQHADNFSKTEPIILANLCVCYILTKQNVKAEELIKKISKKMR